MQNWLARVGFPVRESTFAYDMPVNAGHAGYAFPGQVFINPNRRKQLDSVAARWGKRGRLAPEQLESLRILMHENLHQMRYGRGTSSPDQWEEGATEAATQDLLPIFAAKMYGMKMGSAPLREFTDGMDYTDQTRNLRQLSRFGSGAADYTKRPARVWRRTFLHGDTATRQRMADEAMAARVKWGENRRSK
jgi:hypothetical protein